MDTAKDGIIAYSKQISLFFVLMLIPPLVACGIIYLDGPEIRLKALNNLQAISELKANQIRDWLAERRFNLEIIADDRDFVMHAEKMVVDGNEIDREIISERMNTLSNSRYYDGVLLVDNAGKVLMNSGRHSGSDGHHIAQWIKTALEGGQIVRSDLYPSVSGHIHITHVLPLASSKSQPPRVFLVLHTPVEHTLFDLIRQWPMPTLSAQSVLVRNDSDRTPLLNNISNHKTAFNLYFPHEKTKIPDDITILEDNVWTPSKEVMDDHNQSVLFASHSIADTTWHVVSRIDREEIMAPMDDLVRWISLLTFAAMGAMTLIGWLLWRQIQHNHHLKLNLLSRELRQEGEHKFRRLYETMLDAYVMTDMSGQLIDYNPAFQEILGYSDEELRAPAGIDLAEKNMAHNRRRGLHATNPAAWQVPGL